MSLGQYKSINSSVLKGLYRFEGNSTDESGNGYNGTDTNVSYGLGYGRLSQGANFNGSSSKILTNLPSWAATTPFTINAWVKLSSSVNNYTIFSLGRPTTGYASWCFGLSVAANLIFMSSAGASDVHATCNKTTEFDKWYMCTVTYSGAGWNTVSAYNFYLDGELCSAGKGTAGSAAGLPSTAGGAIGYTSNVTGSFYFNGNIDEVFIENVVWSAAKIKKLYTFQKGLFATI